MNRPRVGAALMAVCVIWGSTYLAIKHMVTGFPPLLGSAIRFLVAGGLLYGFAARRSGRLDRRLWKAAIELGALLIVGGVGLVTVAESTGIGSGLAATAAAAIPLWASVVNGLSGTWPRRREWWGLGIGMMGVALLGFEGDFSSNRLGAALMLAAPICWAVGSIRRTRVAFPAGQVGVGAEMLAGGALLLLLAAARGERLNAVPGPEAWLGLTYLIVFGSLVAFSAYMYLLDNVRPALATSYAYVNPVVAMALGLTLGAESVTASGLAALPLILSGVALMSGLGVGFVSPLFTHRRQPEFDAPAAA
ncbi:MAG: drug/metabolite exporter YedA [Acidimicrobiia bacterium]|nr:drug/metabolite exporter YedA [Acidimicrobiia bacterium]MDH4306044.1 drug/metabolite exporter YedA [Acidimicrobiia bacterium]MDH5292282.1 drug/metabolite exporter YedA [Acidimicrobiia bacterium]